MAGGGLHSLDVRAADLTQIEAASYNLRRMTNEGKTVATHTVVACDDEEAIEMAYLMCGPNRAQLWQGARLVHQIEAFVFKRAPSGG